MDTKNLTIIGHLEEFRRRVIICLISLLTGILVTFPFSTAILHILKRPASGFISKLAFFNPVEGFTAYFKIAFFSGLMVAMPVILYQLWAFVSPAIEERVKRYSLVFVAVSLSSFILGCLFAYFMLLPSAFNFLLSIGKEDLMPMISVEKYISFTLTIILCTGLVFEMPIAVFVLTKMGIANHRFLRKKFKYAILAIFIAAAIITPTPDVFNMTLLAIPMVFLYEISIWVSFFARSKKS